MHGYGGACLQLDIRLIRYYEAVELYRAYGVIERRASPGDVIVIYDEASEGLGRILAIDGACAAGLITVDRGAAVCGGRAREGVGRVVYGDPASAASS